MGRTYCPDFSVAHFDAADKLAHVALAQTGVLVTQPRAGHRGKPRNIALCQQVARHLAVLLQGAITRSVSSRSLSICASERRNMSVSLTVPSASAA
jgi:hypothetical protein